MNKTATFVLLSMLPLLPYAEELEVRMTAEGDSGFSSHAQRFIFKEHKQGKEYVVSISLLKGTRRFIEVPREAHRPVVTNHGVFLPFSDGRVRLYDFDLEMIDEVKIAARGAVGTSITYDTAQNIVAIHCFSWSDSSSSWKHTIVTAQKSAQRILVSQGVEIPFMGKMVAIGGTIWVIDRERAHAMTPLLPEADGR